MPFASLSAKLYFVESMKVFCFIMFGLMLSTAAEVELRKSFYVDYYAR